jgi:signal transduction histidine kinase/DNA-binding NarL/FixJ family response regulator
MRLGFPPHVIMSEPQHSFEVAGSGFLDKAMPLPVAATCAYVVISGEHRPISAGFALAFIAANIVLNSVIKSRVSRGVGAAHLIDTVRAIVSLLLLPPLVWAAGPTTPAWLVAIPALVAIPFLLQLHFAVFAEAALIVLVMASWQRLSSVTEEWGAPALAMAAVATVCVPVAHAMRQRGRRLVEATRELQVATDQATQASLAKSTFLAHVSHELRTPLGAIAGYADLLSDPRTEEQAYADSALIIGRNAKHLVVLVNEILDVAKIEAGELIVESEPARVRSIVENVASLMRVKASEKGLGFRVEYATPIPVRMSTDPFRVTQILLNLVSNAIKFTKKGDVSVRVAMSEHLDEIYVDVSDTGIGIEADRIDGLFEPFVQAEVSTARKFGGTGLGLSIARDLAELLGGRLDVESTLGVGSRFRLALKVSRQDAVQLEDVTVAASAVLNTASDEQGVDLSGVRLLLAEDFIDSARLIALHLERAGASVVLVADGAAAVTAVEEAKAAEQPFDAVLMDMQMPVLDGYAATRQLRSTGSNVPVIALTAHAMAGDRERCLRAGCDAYATKPVNFDQLLQLVAETVHPAAPSSDEAATVPTARADAKKELEALLAQSGADFARRLPDQLISLETSWRKGDRATTVAIAHKLAGSAGMYGLPECGEAARAVELAITEGSTDVIVNGHIATLALAVTEAAAPDLG